MKTNSDGKSSSTRERAKVIRLELEYSDGRVLHALGNDAESIWRAFEEALHSEQFRGRPYSGPKLVSKPLIDGS